MRKTAVVLASIFLMASWRAPAAFPEAPNKSNDEVYRKLKVLTDVLHYIQEDYVDPVSSSKLLDGALSGMVDVLDPFSQYLNVSAAAEMDTETRGRFGGVGIQLDINGDWLTIITALPGTPAYKVGLLPNDRISAIDGENMKDATLEYAQEKLRGKPGTTVSIAVLRGPPPGASGGWTPVNFSLKRASIKIESVQSRMLEDQIGYARLIEFNAGTAKDCLAALKTLKKEGATSLILDLRNNPGGLLSSAVEIASYFLNKGSLVVYTQGRDPDDRQEFKSAREAPFADIPLVVLINEGSASAAEIVSGALQDNRRAIVIGMRSYGKASVQSVIPLDDGSSLRLTVARYYTPSGRSIQRSADSPGGIVPDIVVSVSPEVEAKLYDQWDMVYAKDAAPHSRVDKKDRVADEILDRAVEILKARRVLGALQVKPS